MVPKKILLIIEKENTSGELWGRVQYDDNLILESAKTVEELQNKMKVLLQDFHDVKPDQVKFDLAFDLTTLFQEKSYLNLSAVADRLGINRSLMAQYAAGIKFPSVARAKEIEQVIHGFGNELRAVKIALKGELVD
jgi:hypothetical protein